MAKAFELLTSIKTPVPQAKHARGDGPDFEEWYVQNLDDDDNFRAGLKNKGGANYYIKKFRDQFEAGEKAASQLSESFLWRFPRR